MNESDFTLTGAERVKIPPHCANCPILGAALQQLEKAYEELNRAMSASIDSKTIGDIQEDIRNLALAHGHSDEEAVAISGQAIEQARELISGRANYLDNWAADLAEIIRGCPGTTTMRAVSARVGGGAIQATFCMNPELVEHGGSKSVEPVSVTRVTRRLS